MPQTQSHKWIPTFLTLEQFETFVLPHLPHRQSRASAKALFACHLQLHFEASYIQDVSEKELPIEKDKNGHPEIHHFRHLSSLSTL